MQEKQDLDKIELMVRIELGSRIDPKKAKVMGTMVSSIITRKLLPDKDHLHSSKQAEPHNSPYYIIIFQSFILDISNNLNRHFFWRFNLLHDL